MALLVDIKLGKFEMKSKKLPTLPEPPTDCFDCKETILPNELFNRYGKGIWGGPKIQCVKCCKWYFHEKTLNIYTID